MNRYFITLIIIILMILTSCSHKDNTENKNTDLAILVDYMTGSFSSQEQSWADSSYFDIRLQMVPVWQERSDGHWIYVEQAVADYLDQPYRQRVYRVTEINDTLFESRVYTIEDPLRFAGCWIDSLPLKELTPDSLAERKGCSIFLTKTGDNFEGSTKKKECSSDLRGASYAISEVVITANQLISWDRGFDSDDNQVWGAEKGGYIFKKIRNY